MRRSRWIIAALLAALLVLPVGALMAKDLNFALAGNPDTLDPHKTSGTLTFQTLKSVYDTLAEADPTGKIVPALAESWTVSGDWLTWTFKLRQGVVFHNGDKLTSADVKATFDRIRDKATASPKAAEYAAIAVGRDARRRHRRVQAQPALGPLPRGHRLGLGRDPAEEPHRPEAGTSPRSRWAPGPSC